MMKNLKIALLLGLFLISAQCIVSEIITTSSSAGSQLNNGLKKKILPKEHFCSQNKIQKLTCQAKSKKACKGVSLTENSPICGFDNLGQRFQFKRQCEACENANIKYYFKGTCSQAPDICKKTQECVNGMCIQMLVSSGDAGRVVCNVKTDCPSITDLCVANKCIDKRQLMGVMREVEKKNPKLAQKTKKMRGGLTKQIQEIRKKNVEDLVKIKKINQEINQKKALKNKNQPLVGQNLISGVFIN